MTKKAHVPLTVEAAEEFTDSLGQILAGGWRQIALADRLGVPALLDLTTREWVEQRLGGYVRLSVPERREAVAELVADGMTQRQVADVLGVGKGTVGEDVARNRAPTEAESARNDGSKAAPARNRAPTEAELERQAARDVTLAIADAVRYLDLPVRNARAVARRFDPELAGITGEDWTRPRFERAAKFLAALIAALPKESK